MATAIRFHLDENVNLAVARGLQLRGVDVSTTQESGLLTGDDESQLQFAIQEGRVLFTHDADFLSMIDSVSSHPGIVYSRKDSQSIGEIVRYLVLMTQCVTANEMCGTVEFF